MQKLSKKRVFEQNSHIFRHSLLANGAEMTQGDFGTDIVSFIFNKLEQASMVDIEYIVNMGSFDDCIFQDSKYGWFLEKDLPKVAVNLKKAVDNLWFGIEDFYIDDVRDIEKDIPDFEDTSEYVDYHMSMFVDQFFHMIYSDLEDLVRMDRRDLWSLGNHDVGRTRRVSRKRRIISELYIRVVER